MERCKRGVKWILLSLLIVLLCPMRTFAVDAIDPERSVRLTIDYHKGDVCISGAAAELYHVATVSPYVEFTLTEEFDYPIRIDGLDAAGWNALALTLAGYVQADGLKPLDTQQTDEHGRLVFQGSDETPIKPGLYLVLIGQRTIGSYTYHASPFLVCLPGEDLRNNSWNYDVTVEPKCTQNYTPPYVPEVTITRKVLKVWNDAAYESERPAGITVQLLRDGIVHDTVTLTAENSWRHTWDNLSQRHNWVVVEQVPEHYLVQIAQEGITFVVTNTYEPQDPPVEPTDPPVEPTDPPVEPTDPPVDPDVPQTGILWWPVPVLGGAGLAALVIGLLRGRDKDHE